jgi:hypothetical protein
MLDPVLLVKLLALLGIANGAPILAEKLLKHRFAVPVDGGLTLADRRPVFGASKTIRGIIASLACTTLAAPLLALDWTVGAVLAAASMAGDLGSSFIKRRIGLKVHAQAHGLDHIPEALIPLVLLKARLELSWAEVAILVAAFVLCGAVLSRVLGALRIRGWVD